ncbi:MAG: hypothetical protein DWH91_01890 [Planctomycetota bacterium]|nr:MAG: hypothetical protein DWH91_01890 [Planctomycetota bacterium]
MELEQQLRSLQSEREALVLDMRRLGEQLRQRALIRNEHSIADFSGYGDRHRQLQVALDLDQTGAAIWSEFESRINMLHRVTMALATVRPLRQLAMTDGVDPELLAPVLNDLDAVETRLTNTPWIDSDLLIQLEELHHPLAVVWKFLNERAYLTDEAWSLAVNVITQTYGPRLATAILRDRIPIG